MIPKYIGSFVSPLPFLFSHNPPPPLPLSLSLSFPSPPLPSISFGIYSLIDQDLYLTQPPWLNFCLLFLIFLGEVEEITRDGGVFLYERISTFTFNTWVTTDTRKTPGDSLRYKRNPI